MPFAAALHVWYMHERARLREQLAADAAACGTDTEAQSAAAGERAKELLPKAGGGPPASPAATETSPLTAGSGGGGSSRKEQMKVRFASPPSTVVG